MGVKNQTVNGGFMKVKDTPDQKPGMVKDTSIYGSYLKKQFCYQLGCTNSEFLVYPEANVCHCGFKKAHIHCKHCGGIAKVG